MRTGVARRTSDQVVRAFIAIEIGDAAREVLTELNGRLAESLSGVRWTKPENLHLTLRFLGDVMQDELDRIRGVLSTSCKGLRPLELRVEGLGVFPDAGRPRIVWAGVHAEGNSLALVQAIAEEAARAGGLAPDARRFHPHITLGRVRRLPAGASIVSLLEREGNFAGGEFTARHVSLFQSTLTCGGAQYERIGKYSLE